MPIAEEAPGPELSGQKSEDWVLGGLFLVFLLWLLAVLLLRSTAGDGQSPAWAPSWAASDPARSIEFLTATGLHDQAAKLAEREAGHAGRSAAALTALLRSASEGVRGVPPAVDVAPLLMRLGWRYTPAQQALIEWAEARGDYRIAFERAEALLRRQVELDYARAIIADWDSVPEVRGILADRLRRDPRWRPGYFVDFKPRSREQIDNRLATVDYLLAHGVALSRGEIAATSNAINTFGDIGRAYATWQRYRGRSGFQADSFAQIADHEPAREQRASIFEWMDWPNEEVRLSVSGEGTSERLMIDWTGRDTPRFLFRTVALDDRPQELRVAIDPGGAEALRSFRFALRCPGDRYSVLEPDTRGSTELRFSPVTAASVGCRFPRLEMSGAAQDMDRPVSAVVRKAYLARAE